MPRSSYKEAYESMAANAESDKAKLEAKIEELEKLLAWSQEKRNELGIKLNMVRNIFGWKEGE